MELRDKVAVVTGGNSGIGKAIATRLAANGCNVLLAGRREEQNCKAVEEIKGIGAGKVEAVAADVSRESDCQQLIEQAIDRFGKMHILVNNAGIGGSESIGDVSTDLFDRVLKTNLYGAFWCAREAWTAMLRNDPEELEGLRGAIINISSLAGKEAWGGTVPYSVSKFGLTGLSHAMADEGQEALIRSIAICPAKVATSMTGGQNDDYIQPEDISQAVLALLSLSPAAWPLELVIQRRGAL